jgi:hypothetical protein
MRDERLDRGGRAQQVPDRLGGFPGSLPHGRRERLPELKRFRADSDDPGRRRPAKQRLRPNQKAGGVKLMHNRLYPLRGRIQKSDRHFARLQVCIRIHKHHHARTRDRFGQLRCKLLTYKNLPVVRGIFPGKQGGGIGPRAVVPSQWVAIGDNKRLGPAQYLEGSRKQPLEQCFGAGLMREAVLRVCPLETRGWPVQRQKCMETGIDKESTRS